MPPRGRTAATGLRLLGRSLRPKTRVEPSSEKLPRWTTSRNTNSPRNGHELPCPMCSLQSAARISPHFEPSHRSPPEQECENHTPYVTCWDIISCCSYCQARKASLCKGFGGRAPAESRICSSTGTHTFVTRNSWPYDPCLIGPASPRRPFHDAATELGSVFYLAIRRTFERTYIDAHAYTDRF